MRVFNQAVYSRSQIIELQTSDVISRITDLESGKELGFDLIKTDKHMTAYVLLNISGLELKVLQVEYGPKNLVTSRDYKCNEGIKS